LISLLTAQQCRSYPFLFDLDGGGS